uniref:Patched domain-containing protein 3-like isoform X2 n=1 Tax=Crassostrea virginica TaxID=6565 RepID=A0A8B8E1R4_CRAVI|nr:patched domain-containing protein 3-like isoform X2 [Crassostrea virginica]
MGKCENFYGKYEKFTESCFEKLGQFISKHPKLIMSICIIANLLCLIGFVNISTEDDVEILYTPSESQAYQDRTFLQDLYPDPTTANFESYQLLTFGRYVDVLILSKNKGNIMSQQYVDEINHVDRFIQDSILLYETDGSTLKYSDLCALGPTGCHILGGVVLGTAFQNQFVLNNLTYPFFNSESISPLFGKTQSQNGYMTFTIGVKLRYYLRQNTSKSESWEKSFLNQISNLKTNITDIAYSNSNSLGTELNKATTNDIKYFSLTFTLMMTYACLASASSWLKCNNVANRMNLGFAGVITPILGIGSALGFVSGIGVKFTSIVGVMPFLIIGIGIDDMFLLMSGMAEALHTTDIKEKMEIMLKSSGISITITSFTDLLAFGIGATSAFVSIRNFCIYTGVAVIFCYINQLFFLSPAICLNEKRTLAGRHYMLCCLKLEAENDKKQKNPCMSGKIPTERIDVESFLEKYPKTIAIKILSLLAGKISICILFLAYIAASIYGAVHLKQGLLLYNLVSESSYFHTYSTWDNDYFTTEPVIAMCIKDVQTYSLETTQSRISSIINRAKLDQGIDGSFEINWLNAYKQSPMYDNTSEVNFVNGVQTFLTNSPRFSNDIIFDSTKTKILSSKFYVKSLNIKSTEDQGSLMKRLREISDNAHPSCIFYTPAFIFFEQFVQILPSTLQTVGIALAVMLVVTFLFMPKPLVVCIVALTLVSIIIGIFGFMYYWDLTLSSITMIHLVMSVGFSVDFSVHICHAFLVSRCETDMIGKALDKAGGPVFNAALSSLLGIFMLAFSESYIFQSFGKVMFLVIFFGLLHAAFFLPLLLHGVLSCGNSKNKVDPDTSLEDNKDYNVSVRDRRNNSESYEFFTLDNSKCKSEDSKDKAESNESSEDSKDKAESEQSLEDKKNNVESNESLNDSKDKAESNKALEDKKK